ncbi:hypothetical protein FRC02_011754 [Tulasnella sp. 418]|nr:hypothetical protein FRC02_011754 [Tulasnella sp. 418]
MDRSPTSATRDGVGGANQPIPPSPNDHGSDKDDLYHSNEEKLEKAKEMAGLQRRNVDDNNSFWQTYVSESGKFDKEMIDNWNENLGSLLLFATLFSAINTAFIIETYKRLQPDATESTNSLLRLMLQHRSDDQEIDVTDRHWIPPSGAVRTNMLLFASLTSSVLASFGAILGKEMLAEYKSAGALKTIPEQGRQRQKKFDSLKRYRFQLLMQILPIMLQLSLALFLMGIIDFLIPMSLAVAVVVIVPVSFGFILYIVSVVVAVEQEDAPFQTTASQSFRSLLHYLGHINPFHRTTFPKSPAHAYLVERLKAIWNRLYRSTEPVLESLKQALFKLYPIVQALYASIIGLAAQSTFHNIRAAFSAGALKTCGWFRTAWTRLSTVIPAPFYAGVLGVMGWFKRVWEALVSIHRTSESTNERDAISGDCVMWLLENSHDTKVIRETLEYIPLLPADILRRFTKQSRILERYVLMYNSTLQAHTGPDMSLHLDEETQRDSIICGTALFHILKLRQEEDRKEVTSTTGGHPELLEVLGIEDLSDRFDLSLLTVFHCMLTQSERNYIGRQNFHFLHTLLKRFLGTLQKRSPGASPASHTLIHNKSSTRASPITLLLDSGIFLALQRNPVNNSPLVLESEDELERIFATLNEILGEHTVSMALSSHVALLIAATQWSKQQGGDGSQTTEVETSESNDVQWSQLHRASLSADTGADFFDNVILAFKLLGSTDSVHTINLYLHILTFTEEFMPKVMDVSRGTDKWDVWISNVLQIIPGMLRLLQRVQSLEHIDNSLRREGHYSAIRIISRLLPDDWMPKDVRDNLLKPKYAKFQILSPLHTKYGSMMASLVTFVLSSESTDSLSSLTRRSVAEVLGWMVVCSQDLPSLIQQTRIYHQSTSVPSFLMSVMKEVETTAGLVELCNYHLIQLLEMSPQGPSPLPSIQSQAIALVLANTPRLLNQASNDAVFKCVVTLLNNPIIFESREQIFWPDSFVDQGLVKVGDGPPESTVVPMLMDFLHGEYRDTWCGKGLIIIWSKLSSQDSFSAADCLYMFREEVVQMILDYFQRSLSLECQVSCQSMKKYLGYALEHARVGDEMRSRINMTINLLKVAIDAGWEAMGLERMMGKIQNASPTIDSQDEFLSDAIHLSNRLGLGGSGARIEIYRKLLGYIEKLDVSRRNVEWSSKAIQLIPGLVCSLHEFDHNRHPVVGYSTIRVISCLLPIDWLPEGMWDRDWWFFARKLQRLISPLHPVYGKGILNLIRLILSPDTPNHASSEDKRRLGEILGWIAMSAAETGRLSSLIDSSDGMYQQSTTIPAFLASLMSDPGSSPHLISLCGYHLKLLLRISSQGLSRVQSEALTITLTNESIAKDTFPGIMTLLDRITQRDPDISWPTSFVKLEIIESANRSPEGKVLRFAKKRSTEDFFQKSSVIWRGEGLMILWRELSKQKDGVPEEHTYMFEENVVRTVLDCFKEAASSSCQVSCGTMEDYLNKVRYSGRFKFKDEVMLQVRKTMGDLDYVMTKGWEAFINVKDIAVKVNVQDSHILEPSTSDS